MIAMLRMLKGGLKRWMQARRLFAGLGGFLFTTLAVVLWLGGGLPLISLGVALVGFIANLCAEFIERGLFFVASPSATMPGGMTA